VDFEWFRSLFVWKLGGDETEKFVFLVDGGCEDASRHEQRYQRVAIKWLIEVDEVE
jgi:hypothetical protein